MNEYHDSFYTNICLFFINLISELEDDSKFFWNQYGGV